MPIKTKALQIDRLSHFFKINRYKPSSFDPSVFFEISFQNNILYQKLEARLDTGYQSQNGEILIWRENLQIRILIKT